MTLQECYEMMGGDYEDVLRRLRAEDRVQRFLLKVPSDPSYELLCHSLEEKNMGEAFRASHTMKGICQNLSLNKLYASVEVLTELLRGRTEYSPEIEPAFAAVKADYEKMAECVGQLQ
jgi:HPt (histidine-containing phosphotransfer) domain-containing protein